MTPARDDEGRARGSAAIARPETARTRHRPERADISATSPTLIRGRLLLAIALAIPLGVYLAVWSEWHAWAIGPIDSLFGPAVAALALMTAANVWLKRRGSRWSFTAAEVIAFYVAIATGVGMIAHILEWGALAPMIAYPIGQANPANRWSELVWPYLPTWLAVTDGEALRGYFLGNSSPYRAGIVLAWLRPALWWTLWTTVLLWVTLCLSVIVRRRWSQEEKLPFPITELPLRMADPAGALFRSPLWWVGIAASVAIGVLRMLAELFPNVPTIPFAADLRLVLNNNPPWDVMRGSELWWGPWAIALPYLMPTDLTLSLIVFNLLWRAEYVLSRMGGWTTSSYAGFPYGDEQTLGAFLTLILIVFWLDRRYLAQALRKAFGLRSLADDSGEAFGYRTAVFGALGGFAFLWWFLAHAGVRSLLSFPLLVSYLLIMLVVCRLRAQVGPPSVDIQTTPELFLNSVFGTRFVGARGLGAMALLRPFLQTPSTNPAPVQLEALRMAEKGGIAPRRLALVLIAVVPLAMVCYFWANLHLGYAMGMMSAKTCSGVPLFGSWTMERLQAALNSPSGTSWSALQAMGFGSAVTIALMAVKLRFPAFPLHPIGFPLAFTWRTDAMLPGLVISWTVKTLLLRYGGLRAHRRALPLFLGIIVGSGVTLVITQIIRNLLGVEGMVE